MRELTIVPIQTATLLLCSRMLLYVQYIREQNEVISAILISIPKFVVEIALNFHFFCKIPENGEGQTLQPTSISHRIVVSVSFVKREKTKLECKCEHAQ